MRIDLVTFRAIVGETSSARAACYEWSLGSRREGGVARQSPSTSKKNSRACSRPQKNEPEGLRTRPVDQWVLTIAAVGNEDPLGLPMTAKQQVSQCACEEERTIDREFLSPCARTSTAIFLTTRRRQDPQLLQSKGGRSCV